MRIGDWAVAVGVLLVAGSGVAGAGERPPPGVAVPCPGSTADHAGAAVAYRCASAVTDVFGNVVA